MIRIFTNKERLTVGLDRIQVAKYYFLHNSKNFILIYENHLMTLMPLCN